jgi:hypothetical protein
MGTNTENPNIPIDVAIDAVGKTAMDDSNNPKLFFNVIQAGEEKSDVITKELAGAVVAEFDGTKYTLKSLASVEAMILKERMAQVVPNEDGVSTVSKIKVHSRRAMQWTPATGAEMRTLFEERDKGEADKHVDLCPKKNPGVWMKLKMRKEFKEFEKKRAVSAA